MDRIRKTQKAMGQKRYSDDMRKYAGTTWQKLIRKSDSNN